MYGEALPGGGFQVAYLASASLNDFLVLTYFVRRSFINGPKFVPAPVTVKEQCLDV